MLLAVDAGNTQTVFGIYRDGELVEHWRVATETQRTGDELGALIGRFIDLDLLLYGDEVVEEPGLTVPHPRLAERLFVLEPLSALDAGLFVPGQGFVEALIRGLQSKP